MEKGKKEPKAKVVKKEEVKVEVVKELSFSQRLQKIRDDKAKLKLK